MYNKTCVGHTSPSRGWQGSIRSAQIMYIGLKVPQQGVQKLNFKPSCKGTSILFLCRADCLSQLSLIFIMVLINDFKTNLWSICCVAEE